MSDRIQIKASEVGVVRVFSVNIPADQIAAFTARNGSWPLGEALGADTLDADHVQVFDASDLAGVGLAGYLEDGHGIPKDQIEPMRARLDGQTGAVMVITSRAFQSTAQTLSPRAPLSLIASFSEPHDPVTFGALPDPGNRQPEETSEKKSPSDAAMSGRVAMVVLLVLALLVVAMVWIA